MSIEVFPTAILKCRDCGAEFKGVSVGSFQSLRCPQCGLKAQTSKADEDRRLRNSKLQEDWLDFCPADYNQGSPEQCKTNQWITDITRLPQPQLKSAMGWTFGKNKGMWFNGPPGKSKTRIMWLLMHKLWMDSYKVLALTAAQFSRGSSDSASKGNAGDWAERLVSARVLFIDDLGKGRMTELNEADLFDILDRRIASGNTRPTFVTSNIQLKQFAGISLSRGEPLLRRLNLLETVSF